MPNTGLLHMVYFWLREEGRQPDDAQKLIDGIKRNLPQIPGVLRLEAGEPATTPRDVVDHSYGVALLVEFADEAAHDVYQDHSDHLAFIEECHSLWSRVQVYDSLIR